MNLPFSNIRTNPFKKATSPLEDIAAPITNTILKLTFVAWIITKIICYKLWLSIRCYPIITPFNFGFEVPYYIHAALFIAALSFLLLLLLLPNKSFLLSLILVELISCLLDQTRWQAWEYQYLLMAAIFLLNWKNKNKLAVMLLLLLAFTYIYSGIHKLNGAFVYKFWQLHLLRALLHLPASIVRNQIVHCIGYLLPLMEVSSGIALLFSHFRKRGALLLIAMHLINLIIFGPFVLNYNSVVWPWNIAMIAWLYLLCIRQNGLQYPTLSSKRPTFNLPIFILIIVMPAFNFIGLWPYYLSFCLYSYKPSEMIIIIDKSTPVPTTLLPYLNKPNYHNLLSNGSPEINLDNWAIKEMNALPYPEQGYFVKIKAAFIQRYPNCPARFYLYKPLAPNSYIELK